MRVPGDTTGRNGGDGRQSVMALMVVHCTYSSDRTNSVSEQEEGSKTSPRVLQDSQTLLDR